MAGYWVDTDVTVSVQMYIDADSEESAKAVAISRIASNAGYYAQSGLFVDAVVTDCVKEQIDSE
jgi:hypothetical protein